MLFNLLNTALLCLFASTAVHATKTHKYTVELTGSSGHKTVYSGTLPVYVPCDTCQPFLKSSYDPEWMRFKTGGFAIKGDELFELKFYKQPLCTGHHLGYPWGPSHPENVVSRMPDTLKAARGFSVCRPNASVPVIA